MNIRDLTLIIPAKFEAESLPSVLNELKNFKCEKKNNTWKFGHWNN